MNDNRIILEPNIKSALEIFRYMKLKTHSPDQHHSQRRNHRGKLLSNEGERKHKMSKLMECT